jgi:membrane protein YqaA with SNARE-associated domain
LSFFRIFLTWWGLALLGVLDTSLVFFMPLGIDAVVIYLAARDEVLFWIYPILATIGSLAGAAITWWIGHKAGEVGLERLVPPARLERLRGRLKRSGAAAMALPAVMPPPFPLTLFILTCGALEVDRRWFFGTFAVVRLLRFSVEATLARAYGRNVLRVLESDQFRTIVIGFIAVVVIGTIVSAVTLWRNTHPNRLRPA